MSFTRNDMRAHERRASDGFTIVELLIVIVVIAILAAITIVSYNGITKRAADSALMTDASSAATQLSVYKVTNNEQYPSVTTSLNDGKGAQKSAATSLQYTVDNSATPASYCMSLTSSATSSTYYVSSTNNAPSTGLCPGHVPNYPAGTNLLTPPANTSNIVVTTPTESSVNMAYSGYVSVYTSATGTPSPTVVSWQRLVPKNSNTGTWEVMVGQTAPQLNWVFNVGYDIAYNDGDYFYIRPIYTNSSGTVAGNAIRFDFFYAGD